MPAPGATAERQARLAIDAQLASAGWLVQDRAAMDVHAAPGVAVREFALASGHGYADYLLFVDGRPVGAVEAKPVGHTLTGVETQSAKYADGVPPTLRPPVRPLPFLYETTSVETQFTNQLDPEPKSRRTFSVHRPETLREWLLAKPLPEWATDWLPEHVAAEPPARYAGRPSTFRSRVRAMPPLAPRASTGLWPAQDRAIRNLEASPAVQPRGSRAKRRGARSGSLCSKGDAGVHAAWARARRCARNMRTVQVRPDLATSEDGPAAGTPRVRLHPDPSGQGSVGRQTPLRHSLIHDDHG